VRHKFVVSERLDSRRPLLDHKHYRKYQNAQQKQVHWAVSIRYRAFAGESFSLKPAYAAFFVFIFTHFWPLKIFSPSVGKHPQLPARSHQFHDSLRQRVRGKRRAISEALTLPLRVTGGRTYRFIINQKLSGPQVLPTNHGPKLDIFLQRPAYLAFGGQNRLFGLRNLPAYYGVGLVTVRNYLIGRLCLYALRQGVGKLEFYPASETLVVKHFHVNGCDVLRVQGCIAVARAAGKSQKTEDGRQKAQGARQTINYLSSAFSHLYSAPGHLSSTFDSV
jgi:hypothetical protein